MAKGDRTGNRKTREQRRTIKVPELGYYLIVTDTEGTERCFFAGLHQSLPEEVRNKLVIKVVETKTRSMIDKCLELTAYEAQYRIPWIVFDRDQVIGFDEIISEAEKKGIQVGWSNPCFEIWMYAYFGACRQFKIHGHAALSLGEYMRARRDRSIPRQMKRCMEKSAMQGMRKRQYR